MFDEAFGIFQKQFIFHLVVLKYFAVSALQTERFINLFGGQFTSKCVKGRGVCFTSRASDPLNSSVEFQVLPGSGCAACLWCVIRWAERQLSQQRDATAGQAALSLTSLGLETAESSLGVTFLPCMSPDA